MAPKGENASHRSASGGCAREGSALEPILGRTSSVAQTSASWAAVLWNVVEGDHYEALPHLAADELETVLRRLRASGDLRCRRVARRIINLLGARGYENYGVLLGDTQSDSD